MPYQHKQCFWHLLQLKMTISPLLGLLSLFFHYFSFWYFIGQKMILPFLYSLMKQGGFFFPNPSLPLFGPASVVLPFAPFVLASPPPQHSCPCGRRQASHRHFLPGVLGDSCSQTGTPTGPPPALAVSASACRKHLTASTSSTQESFAGGGGRGVGLAMLGGMGREEDRSPSAGRVCGIQASSSRFLLFSWPTLCWTGRAPADSVMDPLCLTRLCSFSGLCSCLECAPHSLLYPWFSTPQGQTQLFKFPLTSACGSHTLVQLCSAAAAICSLHPSPPHQGQDQLSQQSHLPTSPGALAGSGGSHVITLVCTTNSASWGEPWDYKGWEQKPLCLHSTKPGLFSGSSEGTTRQHLPSRLEKSPSVSILPSKVKECGARGWPAERSVLGEGRFEWEGGVPLCFEAWCVSGTLFGDMGLTLRKEEAPGCRFGVSGMGRGLDPGIGPVLLGRQ